MSIYVKVGDETFTLDGPGGSEFGCSPSRPVPVAILEQEIVNSRARQAAAQPGPAESSGVIPYTRVSDAKTGSPCWAQVFDGRVMTKIGVDEVADELNALLKALVGRDHRSVSTNALTAWRRWAAELVKSELPQDDDRLRKTITAVIESPSVIATDFVEGARLNRELGALRSSVDDLTKAVDELAPVPRPAPGDLVVEACARVAHDVYRAGYSDMPSWEAMSHEQKEAGRAATRATLDGTTPEQWHKKWVDEKTAAGWTLGDVKDDELKTHPNIRPYDQLSSEGRMLDDAFVAAVRATVQAIEWLEEAYRVPVFKVHGDISSEQFAAFKREWERDLSASRAWATPIINAPEVVIRGPSSPYTRLGTLSFIDTQIDSMLSVPVLWGSFREVELQVILLLEVRGFISAGHAGAEATVKVYERFVAKILGDTASTNSMSDQITDLGHAGETIDNLKEFVEQQRSEK